ncbi:MAG TPA: alpha/beta hydrolase-fold protein [Dermatophilaceae bacterium]|nr:alpha/beta hydrolase-fold protein [Dermatophilaceae bacterium]
MARSGMPRARDAHPARRALLAGAAGWAGTLALAGACGTPTPPGARERSGTLATSRWPGQTPRWRLLRPDPAAVPAPPLVVALHGRGGGADDAFRLGLPAAAVQAGLAMASVDGGETYWHPRRGSDTAGMVLHDLLPLVQAEGVAPAPIGVLGWSMGGYGALWLAASAPESVGAAAGLGSALWTSPGASAAGAFDDRDDFVSHDVFARRSALAQRPVRLACGRADPFLAANRAFAAGLPAGALAVDDGGHDDDFWRARGIPLLSWFAEVLRR